MATKKTNKNSKFNSENLYVNNDNNEQVDAKWVDNGNGTSSLIIDGVVCAIMYNEPLKL